MIDELENAKRERDEAWAAVRIRDAGINATVKIRDARIKLLEALLWETLQHLPSSMLEAFDEALPKRRAP